MADKEIEQAKRVLEMDPTYTAAYLRLRDAYRDKGQWSEALAAYEHAKETDKVGYLCNVAWIWALSGNRHQAEMAMAELKEFSRHNYVSPLIFAQYEAKFGDRDLAFQYLEKAYQEHATGMFGHKAADSFDILRSDPRFQGLERRVGSR